MAAPFQGVRLSLWSRVSILSRQLRPNRHALRTHLEISPRRYLHSSRDPKPVVLHTVIRTASPSTVTRADILHSLQGVWSRSWRQLKAGTTPNIVILATPSFATWLEGLKGRAFIGCVLDFLFESIKTQSDRPDITVVAAVVGGLPAIPHNSTGEKNERNEGFAIMFWERESPLLAMEQIDDGSKSCISERHQTPHIVFSISKFGAGTRLDIAVPLANTLFQTGRSSVLQVSKWTPLLQKSSRSSIMRWQFSPQMPVRMDSITIPLETFAATSSLYFDIPLKILTPFREVVAGLGNIIRQIMSAEGNLVSASEELEASVDAYLAARNLDKQTVNVWALIVPEALALDKEAVEFDAERIRAGWTGVTCDPELEPHVNGLLKRGAHLHRVLGGGGGWGLKQGLLSLDPETTLAQAANNARHDFDSDSDTMTEHDQVSALSAIAKPGSRIQFLISPVVTPDEPVTTSDLRIVHPIRGAKKAKFIFGCIPATIDDAETSLQPSDPSNLTDSSPEVREKRQDSPPIDVFNGFFGARSEAGIFVRGGASEVTMDSKIDVPYSQVIWAGNVTAVRPALVRRVFSPLSRIRAL